MVLLKGDMVGVVKLLLGVFWVKVICKEPIEPVGLLASLRGLKRPSDDSLPSLTLLGSWEAGICIPEGGKQLR